MKDNIEKIEWGSMEIWGPRHLFRERLLYNAFRKELSGRRVLDAGCGSGSMMLKLIVDGYEVAGIENSQKFVDMVQRKFQSLNVDGKAEVKSGSITRIPFPDGTFDGVVAGEVLEHVEDDVKAVDELYRVLKRDGVCAVSVPANPDLWDESDEWAGHKRRYAKQGIVKLFGDNGFKVEDVFFWGFPLVRIYNRLFFLGWLRKGRECTQGEGCGSDSTAGKAISKMLSFIFRFDNLFNKMPLGIGIVLIARKL